MAEVIISKHRNGSLGTVRLRFIGQFTKFTDGDFNGGFGDGDMENSSHFDPSTNSLTFQSKANHGNSHGSGNTDVPF
jgi:replicative DNA helicase